MSEDLIGVIIVVGACIIGIGLALCHDAGILEAIADRIRRGGDKP